MLESAAPSAAASDSFCSFARGHTALCICAVRAARRAATGNGTNGTFRSIQDLAARNQTEAKRLSRQGSRKKTASLPIYRRIQTQSVCRLKSGRQNGVVSQ
jgi:hypothetical protein